MSETNPISISDQAFSIPLILANIFSHAALKKDILPFCLVNRWWNQLATERLWNRFQGLKNDSKTNAFAKFFETLERSHLYYSDPIANADKTSIHQYGRYVKILDLEKLKRDHQKLLKTLEYCPRIETLAMGNCVLDKKQMYDMAERLPELRLFKFNEIDINDGEALGAIAEYCLKLEELSLKRDISCNAEVLLNITERCKRLTKLDIEEKNYEDDILSRCLSNCPNLTFLKIHQCISVSGSLLLNIYKSCPKLTSVAVTNVLEITTEFAIETFKHFKNATILTIHSVERCLESKIMANEKSIAVHLYDAELGSIIDYFKDIGEEENSENFITKRNHHLLKELSLHDFPLNELILGIICERLTQLIKLELSGIQKNLSKSKVLEIIPKSRSIRHFTIRFSYPVDPLLGENTVQLFKKCSQLESIQWQLQRCNRNEDGGTI